MENKAAAGHPGRLDKWIAQQGRLSRSDVKALIRTGQIEVNGVRARAPEQKITEHDEVRVQGKLLQLRRHAYLMMNKPAGVLSATEDKKDRTVLDLVPPGLRRPGLFPAGRLDKDTEGFVLLTDDGLFAHRVLAPTAHVPKTYFARIRGEADLSALVHAFAVGMDLGGGDRASPAELRILAAGNVPEVTVTVYEGVYHQVKRMFGRFGMEVIHLRRTHIGGLALDERLPSGGCRIIIDKELEKIWLNYTEKAEEASPGLG